MIEREADIAMVEDENGNMKTLPAVKILNDRGEFSATMGCIPPYLRKLVKVREKRRCE